MVLGICTLFLVIDHFVFHDIFLNSSALPGFFYIENWNVCIFYEYIFPHHFRFTEMDLQALGDDNEKNLIWHIWTIFSFVYFEY